MAIVPIVCHLALRVQLVGKISYGIAETVGSINLEFQKCVDR
jgi:hypothetical protein